MSVHDLTDDQGKVIGYKVRWRSVDGAAKAKTFHIKEQAATKVRKQAVVFEAEQLARRDSGGLDPDRGKVTLRAFGLEYRENYALIEHSPRTQETNKVIWNKHVLPHLGDYRLTTLAGQPEILQGWKAKLLSNGTGEATVRKALAIVSAVLGKAVEWNRIPHNPALSVKKPSGKRKRLVQAFAPATIESLRDSLSLRDATLVSVLAYCGLRPGEALALTWADIGKQTIVVDKAIADGEQTGTKTGNLRVAELPSAVAGDLAVWKEYTGQDVGLIFPGYNGVPWSKSTYANWRRRVYQPAMLALGIRQTVPYDLRHTCASLLATEQRNPLEAAALMGHSPQVYLSTYAHVIAELRGQPATPVDMQIHRARVSDVSGNEAAA